MAVLPIYNAGKRHGLTPRAYVDITFQEVLENARQKNLLWALVRIHAQAHRKSVDGQVITFWCTMTLTFVKTT